MNAFRRQRENIRMSGIVMEDMSAYAIHCNHGEKATQSLLQLNSRLAQMK